MADKCEEVVEQEDWSSRGNQIKLAVALLRDDYAEAIWLMKRIGSSGEVKEHDYREWPIFRELRKKPDFFATHEEIYGKPFAPVDKIVTRMNKPLADLKVAYAYESSTLLQDLEPDYYI